MRFDRLATFERFTPANELLDEGGTWAKLFEAYVALQPFTGRELTDADQVRGSTSHRVRTHWQPDLRVSDRLTVEGRELHIESVINVGEQNREYELLCKESV